MNVFLTTTTGRQVTLALKGGEYTSGKTLQEADLRTGKVTNKSEHLFDNRYQLLYSVGRLSDINPLSGGTRKVA